MYNILLQVEYVEHTAIRCEVRLLCARDRPEEVRLEWLIRDMRGETEESERRTEASCQCGAGDEAITQAVQARLGDNGSIEFVNECLELN